MGQDRVPAAWSAIARKDAVPPAPPKLVDARAVRSKSGLSTLVVDANAVIGSGAHLLGSAERFVTVREVLEEVRDPQSRMSLAALPIKLEVMEPDSEAVTKVVQFSRATGDLQSLSEVDLKLIALTYTLETQFYGSSHIRTRPPPLQVTPVQKHKQRDPPGWGSNVPNIKEWEELAEKDNKCTKANRANQSKILELKYLNLDGLDVERGSTTSQHVPCNSESSPTLDVGKPSASLVSEPEGASLPAESGVHETEVPSTANSGPPRETRPGFRGGRPRREKSAPKLKPVISIEGKRNVAVGLDASRSEEVEVDSSDWTRACSRTTRRKYLKREARRQARASEASEPSSSGAGDDTPGSTAELRKGFFDEDVTLPEVEEILDLAHGNAEYTGELVTKGTCHADNNGSTRQEETNSSALDPETSRLVEEDEESRSVSEGDEEDTRAFVVEMAAHEALEGNGVGEVVKESLAGTDAGDYAISNGDGIAPSTQTESEESWSIRPLFQSTVACVTGDFAMQNVLLQMGLRLLSPTGVHVRELHRWVLKCTACGKITHEVGRMFCPKCGNGGTLYKVSVTVGANGTIHAGRIRRVNLRGTRYSLPMPKGGRHAQNPILREDQLPSRVLHPKQKKPSAIAGGDVFVTMDTVFGSSKIQNIGKVPQVQQAAAVFGGRRNPNEQRATRKH